MFEEINGLADAERAFQASLAERKILVKRLESRVKPGNSRIFTDSYEAFHLKFTRKPFTPDSDKQGAARELHLKLHFAMSTFEFRSSSLLLDSERNTMVGIDEDLIFRLLSLSEEGYRTYVVTMLQRGLILWLDAIEFYEFCTRYDTYMKYPRQTDPVLYVPTGYFLTWAETKAAPPVVKG